MGKLTAKMVGQISDPGRYGDGAGLYLIVAPTGTKSWVQRVRIDGKRTDRGLGGIAKVTLSTARKAAEANRTSLKRGHNPFTKTSPAVAIVDTPAEAKTIPTFGYAVHAVYEANREEWGDNTAKRWLARMVQHCEALDGREVDGITRRELADILTPLRKEHHETARKVRQGLSKVFRWVRANDYRVDDPADDALGELVSPRLSTSPSTASHYLTPTLQGPSTKSDSDMPLERPPWPLNFWYSRRRGRVKSGLPTGARLTWTPVFGKFRLNG